jgi:hypothetical protein
MGTSVKMIEKYYAKALSEQNAGLAAGFMAGMKEQMVSRLSREATRRRLEDPAEFVASDDPDDHLAPEERHGR